ncbi:MAG: hypothetical protein AB1781_02910 [Pseudomonadota bacterium]
MRPIFFFGLTAAILAWNATPAMAVRWHQYSNDPWFWVDLDSLRQDGALTVYQFAHSAKKGVAPDVGGSFANPSWSAVDCATREQYDLNAYGAWEKEVATSDPEWEAMELELFGSATPPGTPILMGSDSPLYTFLCKR